MRTRVVIVFGACPAVSAETGRANIEAAPAAASWALVRSALGVASW